MQQVSTQLFLCFEERLTLQNLSKSSDITGIPQIAGFNFRPLQLSNYHHTVTSFLFQTAYESFLR